jgi:hypothetical protein
VAITLRNPGTWAVSNATTQTVTLPTHQAGDMLIVRTIRKPFTNPDDTVINTSGWLPVATGVANGSTANGTGTGSMGFKAFYKIATSGAETNPVVTWGTTSAPGACVAMAYQKAGGEVWITPTGNGGGDATARTSQTSTIASHISVTSGDLVDFFRGQCDDSGALTVPTITQSGVTFDAVTESPAAALLDGTSNDIAADGGYRTATAGTSSAAAVVTGTSAASEQHGAWMTRLRVATADPQTVTPTTLALVTTPFEPTVTVAVGNVTVTPTTLALTTATFAPVVTIDEYSAAVRADAPLVYWRLGEPSGGVSFDEIGSADADYTNTPTLGATGLIASNADTAVTFSRASLEYTSADGTMPAGSSTGVTIEGWVSFATVTAATIYPIARWFGGTGSPETSIRYYVDSGAWRYFYQDAGGNKNVFSDAWTPTVGVTYHVVVTHDYSAESVTFYVNGALLSTEDVSANGVPVVHAAGSAATVARAGSDYWDGTIDEVAIYNSVLSGTRVLAHYNAGVGPQIATPTTLALTTSAFAPTVTATEHQLVTPTTLALASETFAPTVTASDHQSVTPDTASLTTATFAPTVTASDHQLATPDVASLALTTFAPTVTATADDNQTATPDTAALVTETFAPVVTASDHQSVTPATLALTLATFAPVVSMTAHVLVTPDTAALGLTTYAPTVTGDPSAGGSGGRRGAVPPPPPPDDDWLDLLVFPPF